MVLMKNVVHSALMLVLNFFTIAVFYAVLEAQFLAVVQIIVYAGAIMVLFLFVLMLLGVSTAQVFTDRIRGQVPVSMFLGVVLLAALAAGVAGPYMGPGSVCGIQAEAAQTGEIADLGSGAPCVGLAAANAEDEVGSGNVRGVGLLLFTDYVWPFEVTSVLLVVAALGAMVLGKHTEDPDDLVDEPVIHTNHDGQSSGGATAARVIESAGSGATGSTEPDRGDE
jgi:NADH-quinone oxidoreductase subunit J